MQAILDFIADHPWYFYFILTGIVFIGTITCIRLSKGEKDPGEALPLLFAITLFWQLGLALAIVIGLIAVIGWCATGKWILAEEKKPPEVEEAIPFISPGSAIILSRVYCPYCAGHIHPAEDRCRTCGAIVAIK